MTTRWPLALFVLASAALLRADGPADNRPDNVRPVPPPGIAIPAADRDELRQGLDALGKEVEALRKDLQKRPTLLELLPDVEVFHKAVRYALDYNEIYNRNEVAVARSQLKQGRERAADLRAGKAPWASATGLVVRGYCSKIDGSVQPYGLVVPASFQANSPYQHRLDLWCHGRGETLTELSFLNGRQRSPGEFTPKNAFVLHLYGRYCNANKFAGEIDGLEALAHVRKHYPIDDNRVVMRGFSMGGAACWQFAVHYPSLWCAAAPGAGFSETADFLKVFQNEKVQPPRYEQKLWHLYDCTDYAQNLYNLPTVAYSGEIDRQKQAADMMAAAMKKEGMTLAHIIGPKTGHKYHPQAKEELNRRIDALAARGRDRSLSLPSEVRFCTWTLRYNKSFWVKIDGLGEHWDRAAVEAILGGDDIVVATKNVTALTLSFGPGDAPLAYLGKPTVVIDGQKALDAAPILSDRSWVAHFRKRVGRWQAV
ncbi:MAG TPA: prolyl oligopeptidase family serine peptidase, partial [Gemmataceae bacterium]|nr:prolyl oligopeptidase family serine peptidase [Gemmataceae bacterium]